MLRFYGALTLPCRPQSQGFIEDHAPIRVGVLCHESVNHVQQLGIHCCAELGPTPLFDALTHDACS
jgi:hypothetical protein